jgi:HD-like signal output (HDOD) protein
VTGVQTCALPSQTLWQHCTQVAALCHALAKRTPGFDPAQALLIGLVHDIGVIPVLTYAQHYPNLTQDPEILERTIQRLRAEFSAMTLRTWDFPEEFCAAALEAEDWLRDKRPAPDYTDILVMAQLHAAVGSPPTSRLPRIDEVPAFRKLVLGRLSPRLSLAVLDEAQQEIEEVRGLLS